MKKKTLYPLSLVVLATVSLLGACNKSKDTSSSLLNSEIHSEEHSSEIVSSKNAHSIAVNIPDGNDVELNLNEAKEGDEIVFTIVTAENKEVDSVTVNGEPLSSDDGVYTFTMPDSNVILNVSVKDKIDEMVLNAPRNLQVIHSLEDGDHWQISFDTVENASKYYLTINRGDESLISAQEIKGPLLIPAYEEDGDYSIRVKASCDNEISGYIRYLDSEEAVADFVIEHYVEKMVGETQFTVTVENGIPYGTATLEYSDGSVFVGTLTEEFKRKEGTHTYANSMYYEGKFVDDRFEDENGFFSWSTTGDYRDGNSYRGKFVGGTTDGQIGHIELKAYHTDATGLQWYEGEISGMAEPKVGATGKARINYGSQYYEGDCLVTGSWNCQRIGQGINVWTGVETCGWFVGNTNTTSEILSTKHFDRYIGGFDCIDHGWFYGNGVMYILNEDNTPYGYVAGNWDWANGQLIGPYEGFDPSVDLLEEYVSSLDLSKSFE